MDATQGEQGATMNPLNAPRELCQQVKEQFVRFLNDFVLHDSGEPLSLSTLVAANIAEPIFSGKFRAPRATRATKLTS